MLILICLIGVAMLFAGIYTYIKYGRKLYREDREWIYHLLNIAGTIVFCISLIILIIVGVDYSGRMIIDEKIAIYKEENEKIEEQMSVVICEYMQYESDTFKELHSDDAIAMVNLYPELKSNELIVKQIDTYINNTNKIKDLECDRLQYRVLAWWLFFGE